MTQKIILTIEIDDSQLDAAQAKVDKLIASLERLQCLKATLLAPDGSKVDSGTDRVKIFDCVNGVIEK